LSRSLRSIIDAALTFDAAHGAASRRSVAARPSLFDVGAAPLLFDVGRKRFCSRSKSEPEGRSVEKLAPKARRRKANEVSVEHRRGVQKRTK
jgi:hypothetical protein